MEERIMTDGQFSAILDLVIAILKKSTSEEALKELKLIRRNLGRKGSDDSEENDE